MKLAALLVVFCAGTGLRAAELSGEEILRSAVDADRRQEVDRQQYTYHLHIEWHHSSPDGSPGKIQRTRDFEEIFIDGEFYRKLVAVDGKPLKPKQAAEEEERIRMTAAERKRKPKRKSVRTGVPMTALIAVMDHNLLREEMVGGRKCWVVQSQPKPGAVPANAWETQALKYRYTMWIDPEEKTPLRREWEVIADGATTKAGSTVKVLFTKVPDGAWLPASAEYMSVTGRGTQNRRFQTDVYSEYRRFRSEATIEFEDPAQ